MRRLFLFLFLFFVGLALAQNPVPNHSFEDWSGDDPATWWTTNISGATNITQSDDAQDGSLSVHGEIVSFFNNPYFPSVSLGGSGTPYPLTGSYSDFEFYYKLERSSGGTETISASALLYDASFGLIGAAQDSFATVNAGWTKASIPFDYDSGTSSDDVAYVQITFSLGADENFDYGAGFYIDNVSLITATSLNDDVKRAKDFRLEANYPNPFNPSTTIRYNLPKAADVRLEIFDATGRLVQQLVSGRQQAGEQRAVWDASGMASGVYLYRLSAGEFVKTRKMLLVR